VIKKLTQKQTIVLYTCIALSLTITLGSFRLFQKNQASSGSRQVLGAEVSELPIQTRGEEPPPEPPKFPTLQKPLFIDSIRAKSFLVYDLKTHATLAEKNSTLQLPIASLTKLMTAFVVYKSLGLEGLVEIKAKDRVGTSPELNLIEGDIISVKDLFAAMLIGSENDAALTLSHYTESTLGTKFISIMNDEAKQLHMNDSQFSNPLGFDSINNFSTAADLQKLVDATQSLRAFSLYGRNTQYHFSGSLNQVYYSRATNKLIAKDPEITGIKTGYTEGAGGAMIVKATRNDNNIIIIVLGSQNRENDTEKLKNMVFDNYVWQ
jgi:serine-type D-Ala-D-Ala carboxypeptidase (penicillin-binding protein 5/6)